MHCIEVEIHVSTLVEYPIAVGERTRKWHFAGVNADVREQLVDRLEYLQALLLGHTITTLSVDTLEE